MTIFSQHVYCFPLENKKIWMRLLRKYYPGRGKWQIQDDFELGVCRVVTPRVDASQACRIALKDLSLDPPVSPFELQLAKKNDLVSLVQLTRAMNHLRGDRTDRGMKGRFTRPTNVLWLLAHVTNQDLLSGWWYSKEEDAAILLLKRSNNAMRLTSETYRNISLPMLDLDDGFQEHPLTASMPEWQSLFEAWRAALDENPAAGWKRPILKKLPKKEQNQ